MPPQLRLTLRGELDLATVASLVVPAPSRDSGLSALLVDVSALTFCDTAGMRALQALCDWYATAGYDVRVEGASAMFRKVARLTKSTVLNSPES